MRDGEAGFTLIEVLIALALFALIGAAGFSLLNAIVGVQSRTDQRLDRLAELQRAMHVVTLDFQQIANPPIDLREGGAAVIRRHSDTGARNTMVVRYDVESGAFRRTLASQGGGAAQEQTLVSGVDALRWTFFDRGVWIDAWPPEGVNGDEVLPEAIAVEVTVKQAAGGLAGVIRRVVRLPARAEE